MKKKLVTFALSALILASCGETPTPSSSAGGGGVTSSEAPVVSVSSGGGGGGDSSGGGGQTSVDPSGVFNGIVRIYFHNDSGTERNKRIYVWCDGVDGSEHDWTGYDKDIGAYFDMDVREAPYAGHVAGSVSFIIKEPGTWAGQSSDTLVKFADYMDAVTATSDGTPLMNVYSCPGEGNTVEAYPDKTDALGDSFKSFSATSDWKKLKVVGSGKIASYTLYCFDEVYLKMNALNRAEHIDEYIVETKENVNKDTIEIPLANGVDPQKTYRISGKFVSNPNKTKKKVATFDGLYDTAKFKSDYTYNGDDLGVKYSKEKTEFRLWAPTSTMVRVNLYKTGTPAAYTDDPSAHALNDYPIKTAWLTAQKGGLFTGAIEGDNAGMYYTYTLYYNETSYETIDPYAHACGINGIRGAILDFSTTNPEGWDKMSFPEIKNPNNLTVYEVHVRDFTADKSWVSNNGNEGGTYNAFAEAGTKYNGLSTGLDHLKELGVNAVQLLPVFDQDNDERTVESEVNGEKVVTKPGYNWGYNPQNYNCVEGAYSSDPYDASVRVKEFKNLIFTLSKSGIRTIMDVVYNHVSSVTKHSFSTVAPRYFFRYDKDMNLIDDTGCSNAVHTERPMTRKYIVDSLKWWASEFKIKGFRFDLMGCIDTTTMRAAKDGVYDLGKAYQDVVMYGEGWSGSMSGAHMLLGGTPSTSGNVYAKLGATAKGSVGCFNDAGRDGAKGNDGGDKAPDISDNGEKNWITKDSNKDRVYNTLTMAIGENRWAKGSATLDPSQTVNYLACHDNYTLYDQINYQFNYFSAKAFDDGNNEWAMKACVDLTALSLFTQGIGFVHGGDEFFRQKLMQPDDPYLKAMQESYHKGSYTHPDGTVDTWQEGDGVPINSAKTQWLVRNSYKYGDAVNAFRWDRKGDAMVKKYYEKVKEVVQLRAKEMGNCLGQTKANLTKAQPDTWCWDDKSLFDADGNAVTPIIAAGFIGQKDGKGVYMLANKGEVASIGIGSGQLEVLYSSTGRKGTVTIGTNNSITLDKFECLIVRRLSGTIR